MMNGKFHAQFCMLHDFDRGQQSPFRHLNREIDDNAFNWLSN